MSENAGMQTLIERCMQSRAEYLEAPHTGAFRLFNGFLEGDPEIVADVYARTLVLYNYANPPASAQARLRIFQDWALRALPWLRAVIMKTRHAAEAQRCGLLVHGASPDRKVREHGVWYAVDLMLNLDSSLYLDTRHLRAWAIHNLAGKKVLNTFAYTGSLGVAARAAGAAQVIHTDLNRRFLNLAIDSYALNGFAVDRADFLTGDFWVVINRLKREGRLFDCVFVDPPFFSVTSAGKVDLVSQSSRVINKVRPLVGHDGYLVVINNALFAPGAAFMNMLEDLCSDGYLSIQEIIPAPPDFTGFPDTRSAQPPVDPAPFNHSTKIVILRARRKDERSASI